MQTRTASCVEQKKIHGIKKVIGIVAGKGGVGKSSVTTCLALSLKNLGFRVGVLDADVYGPSIRKMLPEKTLPEQKDPQSQTILPAFAFEMPCIGMGYFTMEDHPMVIRAPKANALISQFLHSVEWGDLDYLIIDFPPGTGDIQLTLMQEGAIDAAILVTTPQAVARIDVIRAFRMLEAMGVPSLGVIENMSYFKIANEVYYPFGRDGGKELAIRLGIPLIAEIPIDSMLSEYLDNGRSLFADGVKSPAREEFEKIAISFKERLQALDESIAKGLNTFEVVWREMP